MWEVEKDAYCVFVDFKQAFDSVWREALIAVLQYYGFEEKLVEFIAKLNGMTKAVVRKGKITTEKFDTRNGIIQGCPLSPHLFNTYLEWVMAEALLDYDGGINIGGQRISNMRYADDIVLIAESTEEIQE